MWGPPITYVNRSGGVKMVGGTKGMDGLMQGVRTRNGCTTASPQYLPAPSLESGKITRAFPVGRGRPRGCRNNVHMTRVRNHRLHVTPRGKRCHTVGHLSLYGQCWSLLLTVHMISTTCLHCFYLFQQSTKKFGHTYSGFIFIIFDIE